MEETVTIFGIRAILEAIESGKSLDRVWLLKGTQSKLFEQLLHVLRNKNIAFSFVPVERLDRFSSKNHQGAVARIGALSTQDMEPLIESVLKEKMTYDYAQFINILTVNNLKKL